MPRVWLCASIWLLAPLAHAYVPELGPERPIASQGEGRMVGDQNPVALAAGIDATLAIYGDRDGMSGAFVSQAVEPAQPFAIPGAELVDQLDMAFDGERFVVVWDEWSGSGVLTMRLDQTGAPIDEPVSVSVGSGDRPRIACGGGVCVVVWRDFDALELRGARLTAGQASPWFPVGVDPGYSYDVAFDGTDFVVVFESGSARIDAQVIAATQWVLDPNGEMAIAANGATTLTVWKASNWDSLFGQRADGVQLLDAAPVEIAAWGDLFEVELVAHEDGWLVLGEDFDGVEALRVAANGEAIDAERWRILDWNGYGPRAIAGPGQAFFAWTNHLGPTGYDVFVAPISAPGRIASQWRMVTSATALQLAPAIASRDGQTIALWAQCDLDAQRLRAARIAADGTSLDGDGIVLGAWEAFSEPEYTRSPPVADGEVGVAVGRSDGSIWRIGWDGSVVELPGPEFGDEPVIETLASGPTGWLATGVIPPIDPYFDPTAIARVQVLDEGGVPVSEVLDLPEPIVIGARPVAAWTGDAWVVVTRRAEPFLWRIGADGELLAPDPLVLPSGEMGSRVAIVGDPRPPMLATWDFATSTLRATRLDADGQPLDGEGVAHPVAIDGSANLGVGWNGEHWVVVGSNGTDGFWARFGMDGTWVDPEPVLLAGVGSLVVTPDASMVATVRVEGEVSSVYVRTFGEPEVGESDGGSGTSESSATGSEGAGGADVVDRGCGCRTRAPASAVAWWLVAVLAVRRRSRRCTIARA